MIDAADATLVLTRVFDATPERVFDAWLNREEWQAWIGPEGIDCEVPLLEPRQGGRYRITMRMANGSVVPVSGVFTLIERPRSLAFTWGWESDPTHQSRITLTFAAEGSRTRMTLRQEGLGSIANRDDHGRGWGSAFNKLARYLGSTTAEQPRPWAASEGVQTP